MSTTLKALGAALLCVTMVPDTATRPQAPSPSDVLARAIAAMGGQARLDSLKAVRLDVMGHGYALEQSERPEGPWLVSYQQKSEIRDLARRRWWLQTQSRNWNFAAWSPASAAVVAGDVAARRLGERVVPGSPFDVEDGADALDLAPERLLLTAGRAADLRAAPASPLHGVPQHAVAFGWRSARLTLHLSAWTSLPTMLEIVQADRFGIWGDVTLRRWYSYWTLERGGLLFPRQITTEWNGLPYRDETVMAIDVDPAIDETLFAIPDDVRARFETMRTTPMGLAAARLDPARAVEVAAGVVQFPGNWNVLVIRQPDGLVVLEAPMTSRYSAQVVEAVAARFPGVPITAVVSTSDAWPHLGGVREYVARRIPVYVHDLNVPILDRLVRAPRSSDPDALARATVAPTWRRIGDGVAIGTGELRVELRQVRGELGERMAVAWLPGPRLLYASDLVQRNRDGGFFMPSMLSELAALVRREGWQPERVVAMHTGAIPWQEIDAALAAIRGQ